MPLQPQRQSSPAVVIVVGALSAVVLLATARTQITDTNFYTLWEATNLLAGDHPYHDFYEWGVPLQAYVSALGQLVFGYRLIGEFVLQWAFTVAGVVIACRLAQRLCASHSVVLLTMVPAVLLLAVTPTYHYPKLFFYPLAIWVMWRYLDRPTRGRAAALGIATAAAFLFRHDHGVYIGAGSALAFAVERLSNEDTRNVRLFVTDAAAYLLGVLVVLTPWLVSVERNEGVGEYIQSRAQLYGAWSASTFPIRALARIDPVRELLARPAPEPRPAVVRFVWSTDVPPAEQDTLEKRYGLRPLGRRDEEGRNLYEVANVFDPKLTDLRALIRNENGFQFDAVSDTRSIFPSVSNAELWIMQMAFVGPAVLLLSQVVGLVRRRPGVDHHPYRNYVIVAAAFMLIAENRLFREASYVVSVMPVVAVFAAALLQPSWQEASWIRTVRLVLVIPLFALTAYAIAGWVRGSDLFHPAELRDSAASTVRRMVTSPPIDAYEPAPHALHVSRAAWNGGSVDRAAVLIRYMFDCAAPADRVLVTGNTPFHVGYYANLPIAGGQLFWHYRWRDDQARQQQSLALLRRHSVPFVFSANDPVFEDFKSYPAILAYLRENYLELSGSSGLMLVDRRRTPVRRFGDLEFPCFR